MSISDFQLGGDRRRAHEEGQRDVLVAVGVSAAIAVLTLIILSMAATPKDGPRRLAAVGEEVTRLEGARSDGVRPLSYSRGAVCPAADGAASQLQRRLQEAAAPVGMALGDLAVSEGIANEASGLTPVEFSLTAIAPYDSLLLFLGRLAEGRPEIFIDTADLTPRTSVVEFKLTGRVLCWTIAH